MVDALGVTSVTGMVLATLAMLVANRLLPADMHESWAWQQRVFWWAWLLALVHAIWRTRPGPYSHIALAMKPHWDQVHSSREYPSQQALALRDRGAVLLVISLCLCLAADHVSLALLIWCMQRTMSALVVAAILAFRPRWFNWITASMR